MWILTCELSNISFLFCLWTSSNTNWRLAYWSLTLLSSLCVHTHMCTGEWAHCGRAQTPHHGNLHLCHFWAWHSQTSGMIRVLSSFPQAVSQAVTMVTVNPCHSSHLPVSSSNPVTRAPIALRPDFQIRKIVLSRITAGAQEETWLGVTDGDFSAFYSTVVSWQHYDIMEARLSQIVCHGNRWLAVEEATVSERGHIFSESRPRVC